MGLFRFIVYSLIFYVVLSMIRGVFRFLSAPESSKENPGLKVKKGTKYKIDKADVIEAHFEELDAPKSKNQKENV